MVGRGTPGARITQENRDHATACSAAVPRPVTVWPTLALLAVLSGCTDTPYVGPNGPMGGGDDFMGAPGTDGPGPSDDGFGSSDGFGDWQSDGSVGGGGGDGSNAGDGVLEDPPVRCEPQGSLSLDTDVDPSLHLAIRINQVGYDLAGPKRAVIEASGPLTRFQVVRADDAVVFQGALEEHADFTEWGSTDHHYVADFTCLEQPGRFRLYVNGTYSDTFEIGEDLLFEKTFASVLEYFTASRADDPHVWEVERNVPIFDSDRTADVRGGWYDASGDISKYLSHLSYANYMNPQQTPLVAWALAWVRDQASSQLTSRGLLQKVEEEALWGADYLVRVLDPGGYFYINVFDGWSGDLDERRICAYVGQGGDMNADYQAGFREGGGMAIAALARIAAWRTNGAFDAQVYLATAQRAFAHLSVNNTNYLDDHEENIIDDYAALLAASELYKATRDTLYRDAARMRASSLAARLHPDGYFIADGGSRPFWHASDAGLPILALARYAEVEGDETRKKDAIATIRTHLDYLVSVTTSVSNPYGYARQHTNIGSQIFTRFFIPHENETGYWWQGENARLGSLAWAAIVGGRLAYPRAQGPFGLPQALAAFAEDQLDWILGKNPYDLSFLYGFGNNDPDTFCNDKDESATRDGGIANGITGREDDGSGIQWRADSGLCWEDWRWLEQWLPHAAWYMLAITAAAD